MVALQHEQASEYKMLAGNTGKGEKLFGIVSHSLVKKLTGEKVDWGDLSVEIFTGFVRTCMQRLVSQTLQATTTALAK